MMKVGDIVKHDEFYGVIYEGLAKGTHFRVYWFDNIPLHEEWVYQDELVEVSYPPSSRAWMSGEKLEQL